MASKIYTKTGDAGSTALIGGTKVPKSDTRIEAYGTVDELNAYIGLCRDLLTDSASTALLQEVQDRLFTIGSSLACDPAREPKMRIPDLKEEDVVLLEKEMDRMNESIPAMKFFIIPGGHVTLSHLHIARCVCRRAERCCVRLQQETGDVPPIVLQYINRLSDYLFVLSRYIGMLLNIPETAWKARL
ncbi:MAG TPA: cob(I)yrinic acid a,c-diamide adenosyltransferase [Chitinophagaceae bacterium]|nr:cob(I)yrinic acid a,c-diamide adenosyltransferase [Chitinophagaceae bacterium]